MLMQVGQASWKGYRLRCVGAAILTAPEGEISPLSPEAGTETKKNYSGVKCGRQLPHKWLLSDLYSCTTAMKVTLTNEYEHI